VNYCQTCNSERNEHRWIRHAHREINRIRPSEKKPASGSIGLNIQEFLGDLPDEVSTEGKIFDLGISTNCAFELHENRGFLKDDFKVQILGRTFWDLKRIVLI